MATEVATPGWGLTVAGDGFCGIVADVKRTSLIVLAVVVVVVAIATWLLTGFGGPSTASRSAAKTQPSYDQSLAADQLAGLQKQFAQVMEKHQSAEPLIVRIRSYTQAYPPAADGWTLLAQALAYDGKIKQAYQAVMQSLKLRPGRAGMQVMAGTLAMDMNQPELAKGHFSQAVGLDNTQGQYRVLLAAAQIQLHQYDKARTTLLQALMMDSTLYQAHAELASLFAAQDKVNEALGQIKRAIDMTPGDKPKEKLVYIQRRAKLLRRANRPGDSLSVLQDLPLKEQFDPAVLKGMAESWAMMGQPGKAAANYEKARVFHPVNKDILAEAIYWHLKAGQVDQAKADLGVIRNLDPNWPGIPGLEKEIGKAGAA